MTTDPAKPVLDSPLAALSQGLCSKLRIISIINQLFEILVMLHRSWKPSMRHEGFVFFMKDQCRARDMDGQLGL